MVLPYENGVKAQVAIFNSTKPKLAIRAMSSGTYGNWIEYAQKDDLDKIVSKTGVLNPNGSKFSLSIHGINGDKCPIIQLMDSPQTVIRTHCPATGTLEVTLSGEVTYNIRYILWYKEK